MRSAKMNFWSSIQLLLPEWWTKWKARFLGHEGQEIKQLWDVACWSRRKQLWCSRGRDLQSLTEQNILLLKHRDRKSNTESVHTWKVYVLIALIVHVWLHYSLLQGLEENNPSQSSSVHGWYWTGRTSTKASTQKPEHQLEPAHMCNCSSQTLLLVWKLNTNCSSPGLRALPTTSLMRTFIAKMYSFLWTEVLSCVEWVTLY